MNIAQSVNTHHDAITGTHSWVVEYFYDSLMADSLRQNPLASLIKKEALRQGL